MMRWTRGAEIAIINGNAGGIVGGGNDGAAQGEGQNAGSTTAN